jgi:type IV pilus assembly protein PilM
MKIRDIFRKKEQLIAIDIGSSAIKLLALEIGSDKPEIISFGYKPLRDEIFSNNFISKVDFVVGELSTLLKDVSSQSAALNGRRAATAVPGPAVFSKWVKIAASSASELSKNIKLEAGSYIPYNIDDVRIDYQILGKSSKSELDLLVVAVKNEVVDSFLNTFSQAGIEAAVVDVEHFALQNMFELAYPEELEKTVALVNIGARYSSVNIVSKGSSIFTGDISVGGKMVTDALMSSLALEYELAEALKRGVTGGTDTDAALKIIAEQVDLITNELNRQLSFFWSASGAEGGISSIGICGGSSQLSGLRDRLGEKSGVPVFEIDPLRGFNISGEVKEAEVANFRLALGIVAGLATRVPGDRTSSKARLSEAND